MTKSLLGRIVHAFLLVCLIFLPDVGKADGALLAELEKAFKNRNVATATRILGGNIDVKVEMHGWPLIVVAANHGRGDIVLSIIATGADINATNRRGDTAAIIAAYNNNLEIVELLARHGAELDIRGNDGATALIWAVKKKNADIVRTLLRYGANPNVHISPHGFTSSGGIPVRTGDTALIIAAEMGKAEIVELLLDAGADINATDLACCSALCTSLQHAHKPVTSILAKRGASMSPACFGEKETSYFFIGFAVALIILLIWEIVQARPGVAWRITGYLANAILLAIIAFLVMPAILYDQFINYIPLWIVVAVLLFNIAALIFSRHFSVAHNALTLNRVLNYVLIFAVIVALSDSITSSDSMVAIAVAGIIIVGSVLWVIIRVNIVALRAQYQSTDNDSDADKSQSTK